MSNYRRSRADGAVFFFTVVTHKRLPIFKNIENVKILRKIIKQVSHELPFNEIACVVLHDHVHSIWSLPDSDHDFSKRWGLIKARFTKKIRSSGFDCYGSITWQKRFWEHEIRDFTDFNHHLDYIHYNPVKHGYVDNVSEWKYSSFHRFLDDGYYSADWGREIIMDRGCYGE